MLHASSGVVLGIVGLTLPLWVVQDVTFPLWWRAADHAPSLVSPGSTGSATLCWSACWGWCSPASSPRARHGPAAGWPGARLLAPPPGTDLTLRVAELVSTRAAALDAHAAELRRIERSLHDGTQNRLVAVTVLLGAARRMVARDPAGADELLERAQAAAEQALAELRAVARGILPPVLADRGLDGRAHRAGRGLRRCRAGSTSTCPAGAPPRSRRPPTSWWPRR